MNLEKDNIFEVLLANKVNNIFHEILTHAQYYKQLIRKKVCFQSFVKFITKGLLTFPLREVSFLSSVSDFVFSLINL